MWLPTHYIIHIFISFLFNKYYKYDFQDFTMSKLNIIFIFAIVGLGIKAMIYIFCGVVKLQPSVIKKIYNIIHICNKVPAPIRGGTPLRSGPPALLGIVSSLTGFGDETVNIPSSKCESIESLIEGLNS
jgi:hypothetical protein